MRDDTPTQGPKRSATVRTVYKYPLPFDDIVTVSMPAQAHVLHVGGQDGTLCVWALVDPETPLVPRRFRIAGTGHRVNCTAGDHVGTVMAHPFVWHVFDLGEGDRDG